MNPPTREQLEILNGRHKGYCQAVANAESATSEEQAAYWYKEAEDWWQLYESYFKKLQS